MFCDLTWMSSVQDFIIGCLENPFGPVFHICMFILPVVCLFIYLLADLFLCFHKNVLRDVGIMSKIRN